MDELVCKELVELITEYLEGTLPDADRQRFDHHLLSCDGCTSYVAQMRQTLLTLGQLTEEAIPEPVQNELLVLFRDWKRSR